MIESNAHITQTCLQCPTYLHLCSLTPSIQALTGWAFSAVTVQSLSWLVWRHKRQFCSFLGVSFPLRSLQQCQVMLNHCRGKASSFSEWNSPVSLDDPLSPPAFWLTQRGAEYRAWHRYRLGAWKSWWRWPWLNISWMTQLSSAHHGAET